MTAPADLPFILARMPNDRIAEGLEAVSKDIELDNFDLGGKEGTKVFGMLLKEASIRLRWQ